MLLLLPSFQGTRRANPDTRRHLVTSRIQSDPREANRPE